MSQGLLAHPRASYVRRHTIARAKEMVKNLESILARVWHSGSGDALSTLDEHYSTLKVFADLLQNQDGASQYTDVLADVWHQIARVSVTRSVLGESAEREWIDCFKKEAEVRCALITELERADSIHLIGGADHQGEACRQVRLLLRSYSELALAYHNHHKYGEAVTEYGKCEELHEQRHRQLTRIQNTTEMATLRSLNEKARDMQPPTGNFRWFRGDDVAGVDQVSRSAASINADPGVEAIMPDAPAAANSAQVPKRNRKRGRQKDECPLPTEERLRGENAQDMTAEDLYNLREQHEKLATALREGQQRVNAEITARERVENAYPSYVCPLTLRLMEDPVVDASGHTYERAAIEEYFAGCQKDGAPARSPITNEPLPDNDTRLTPIHLVRSLILTALEEARSRLSNE